MLFLLVAASEGLSLLGLVAGAATIFGAVKLGLETYEKYDQLRDKKTNEKSE